MCRDMFSKSCDDKLKVPDISQSNRRVKYVLIKMLMTFNKMGRQMNQDFQSLTLSRSLWPRDGRMGRGKGKRKVQKQMTKTRVMCCRY